MFLSKYIARFLGVVCVLGMVAAIAGEPQPEENPAVAVPPQAPPVEVPEATQPLVRPKLAYLAGGSTWNLSEEEFLYFLADFPKALLFRCPARHLSSDARFHYYGDSRMNRQWAFEPAPEDNFFTKRAIWSKDENATDWQLVTDKATLAAPW